MNAHLRICHVVESYYPSVGGMQEVVRQLSERLARWGHQVTVVTSDHPGRTELTEAGVAIRPFRISGNAVRGIHGETAEYTRFLLEETSHFDVIVFFAAQQWATDLALPLLGKIRAAKVFVPTGFSLLQHPDYADYYRQMKIWIRQMDRNVFLSDDYRDVRFARGNGAGGIVLIPNGAAEEEFESDERGNVRGHLGVPADHQLLLHVGTFIHSKGQLDAIDIFLRSGVRGATLLLIGNRRENFLRQMLRRPLLLMRACLARLFGRKRIISASLPRALTVEAYREADLFLFPSKIECSPIVLFEAMAARTPFLTTDVGNAAEIVRWSDGGWIMPTDIAPDGFSHAKIRESAEMLTRIMRDPDARAAAAERGHKAWKERFTWSKIAKQYELMYYEISQRK
jgi:L-malate glycosyltransferase